MKIGSFWANEWVQAISRFTENHQILVQGILIAILLPLIPKVWNEASDRFEKKHYRLLLTIATVVILATVVFLVHFLLVTAPRDYPNAH